MKRLIDAIIKKWFCCHEWEFQYKEKCRSWLLTAAFACIITFARSAKNIKESKHTDYDTGSDNVPSRV